MNRTESLSQWLREVHAGCLAVVEPLPPEQWRQQPATGGWSAAEVFAHLGQAESAIQAGMKRVFSTEHPFRTGGVCSVYFKGSLEFADVQRK